MNAQFKTHTIYVSCSLSIILYISLTLLCNIGQMYNSSILTQTRATAAIIFGKKDIINNKHGTLISTVCLIIEVLSSKSNKPLNKW